MVISTLDVNLSYSSCIYDGLEKKPDITIMDHDEKLIEDRDYDVVYSNNIDAGKAIVTITGKGDYSGSTIKTFFIEKAEQKLTGVIKDIELSTGAVFNLTVDGLGTVTFESDNDDVVMVNNRGKVVAMTEGTATVTVTASGDNNHKSVSASLIVTVVEAHEHVYTVEVTKESSCVVEGINTYTCTCGDSYTETIPAIGHNLETTTQKATLTKNGNLTDICSICHEVISTSIVYYPKTFTLSKTEYVYDGKVKSPKLTVQDSAGKVIDATNYVLTKSPGRKDKGWYDYVVEFKGDYSGTKVLSFAITPIVPALSSISNVTEGISLKWSEVTGAVYYYVYRKGANDASYSKIAKVMASEGCSYVDKTVKNKGKYAYKIKAFNSSKSYSSYSNVKEYTYLKCPESPYFYTNGKLKWGSVSGASGYSIQYSTSSKFTNAKTIKLSGTTTTTTISGFQKGKRYYVRLRAYRTVNGKTYYSAWSVKDYATIK